MALVNLPKIALKFIFFSIFFLLISPKIVLAVTAEGNLSGTRTYSGYSFPYEQKISFDFPASGGEISSGKFSFTIPKYVAINATINGQYSGGWNGTFNGTSKTVTMEQQGNNVGLVPISGPPVQGSFTGNLTADGIIVIHGIPQGKETTLTYSVDEFTQEYGQGPTASGNPAASGQPTTQSPNPHH